mmetsp:Transcript_28752/g.52005  ORF Transcript_28752/g.52005 Transcript_28752/m.52005 type:complete len:229 (-) Transcript_28752:381-1067(-)
MICNSEFGVVYFIHPRLLHESINIRQFRRSNKARRTSVFPLNSSRRSCRILHKLKRILLPITLIHSSNILPNGFIDMRLQSVIHIEVRIFLQLFLIMLKLNHPRRTRRRDVVLLSDHPDHIFMRGFRRQYPPTLLLHILILILPRRHGRHEVQIQSIHAILIILPHPTKHEHGIVHAGKGFGEGYAGSIGEVLGADDLGAGIFPWRTPVGTFAVVGVAVFFGSPVSPV